MSVKKGRLKTAGKTNKRKLINLRRLIKRSGKDRNEGFVDKGFQVEISSLFINAIRLIRIKQVN